MGVEMQIASLALGVMSAQQQRKAYEMEAQSYREQADMAELQAGQQEEARRQQMRRQLAALGASMASQGVSIGSQSVQALGDDEMRIAKNDIASIRLMGMSNRRKYELSAGASMAGAKAATLGGFTKSAATLYDMDIT